MIVIVSILSIVAISMAEQRYTGILIVVCKIIIPTKNCLNLFLFTGASKYVDPKVIMNTDKRREARKRTGKI
jgi:hypothetical protein